ncbi:bifunctional 4-hydroxy-2-oxoglutarate aldolase/2-dehydro-3-deoxy-phosphogluconate aldolase [Tenacibaculum jejuense]|uniref:2-dehydro-3-deoxy-6-phosphogalactonate aldolase n=1 Tax=Tenacibaculum jejuense TaxID=584609 RepID=A0A238UBW2_9FLAO|nr:bifunctional 4-hydroxy-2-oxoglutarate aldolase/2-dehydro-3-deoxy-phosphogluconate aldolase [Tenacibaculum jejuense]SNR16582.1 2-dehydro-3-deoxy-6-phosphogalactonate aldolase [Tenacibaculum jejuense]
MIQNNSSFSWNLFNEAPVVGIVRGLSKEITLNIAKTLLEAEFYTLEVTMNTEGALELINELTKQFPKLNIGAGTVCTLDDCKNAIKAGAQFIVTPIIDEDVITYCVSENIPVFPGAYTPTEIYKAWSLGASAVKVFPATQLGSKYIKDVLAPLNEIKLLPTGGVSKDNITSFFNAGAVGVGMGSSLLHKEYIATQNFTALKEHFVAIKQEIQDYTQ